MSEPVTYPPITENDDFISDALREASIPALMGSLSHLRGDLTIWGHGFSPSASPFGPIDLDGMTEEQRELVRAEAVKALAAYRDRGSPTVEPLDGETLLTVARLVIGNAAPDAFLPMLLADSGIDDSAIAPRPWSERERQKAADFAVLIVGAGMSGILMAIRMAQAGIPYTIIEKNAEVGGTWLVNSYPGCRCDVPNFFYSYSFEQRPDWSHQFCERDDILAYFQELARTYGVLDKIEFGSEVTEAVWQEHDSTWRIAVARSDGTVTTKVANAFIPAVGQLSRPKTPALAGAAAFRGVTCHTGAYDRSLDFAGKRVAVVGTGASGIQAIPEIAAKASHLFVVQRSAHWLLPSPNHQAEVPSGQKWLLKHVPHYARWYRARYASRALYGLKVVAKIDPSWPHQERSVSAANDQVRERLIDHLKSELSDRPDLLEKVVPKYPPFATRILPNDGSYLRALKRDTTELVVGEIASLDEDGIVMADGRHLDVDIILYATGFQSSQFLQPMRIVGRGGEALHDYWGQDARAYLGITVPKFPNLFMVFGPGTAVFNVIFLAECNSRYIMDAVQGMIESDLVSIECRQAVYDEYVDRYRQEANALAIATPGVSSWYKSASGNVVSNLPFDVPDYWNWTRKIRFEDFHVAPNGETSSTNAVATGRG